MKMLLTGILCLLLSHSSLAQKDVPAFGKIEKADLQMKECDFDKAAEAVVLFDVAEVYCFMTPNAVNLFTTQVERHVRIKILDKKGLDQANIKIPYFSYKNIEEIKNISAQTINLDEAGNIVVTKVDKKLIYNKKINKRYSEIVFAFPDVKPGSIIEYKYRDEASDLYALQDWFFQKEVPVKLSRYIINFPVELTITAQPKGSLIVETVNKKEGNRDIKTFAMKNVPALRDEPFISCNEDYLQQVIPYMVSLDLPGYFTQNLLRTWPGIVKQLMDDEDFGLQLKKNLPRTSELDATLKNISDPYKKMAIIHSYVKKNMEWNNSYGIWALDGVKAAWRDKKGTTGEINLILVNLLKDADLDAYPILVSTRKNGRINTSIAGYDQFNKVMAYVMIANKTYVLDATDKYTPIQLIPPDVLYSEGLLIQKYDTYEWGWRGLVDGTHGFNTTTLMEASVDEKGKMTGQAQVSSTDYSRLQRSPKLKEGKEKFIETYFHSAENNIKVDSLSFDNEEVDSLPLVQSFKFSQDVSGSGGYNYFSANLFSGLEKNPFIADNRYSDVFFGANQNYTIDANFTIPAGYSFDALPKNVRMRLPDTSIVFSRRANVAGKTLSVRMELEFKKPFYSTDEYEGFHELYKKLYSMLNEQFVYKKD